MRQDDIYLLHRISLKVLFHVYCPFFDSYKIAKSDYIFFIIPNDSIYIYIYIYIYIALIKDRFV